MVANKRLLVLWDVDHTLIENSGVSKATYALAFEKLTGMRAAVQPSTDGRTDREIMRNLFTANDFELTPGLEESISSALIDAGRELTGQLLDRGYALPGVLEVLERLDQYTSVVQSVLTGNIRPNADNKLKLLGNRVSLLDLEVGGYGSDDLVRSRLVAIAQAKAGARYEAHFDLSSTVLVGDTERDVLAAKDGGAMIIGVATGVATQEQLQHAGADAVLPDLADTEAFLTILANLTGQALSASV